MKHSGLGILAAMIVLVVPASGLAAAAGGHNPYLSAAITLYGDLEFESALENLKKAEKQASSSMAEDVQINLYMGLILFELGDADGAQARFKRALALDEKVALPKAVSPKTAAAFEKARRDISKARSHNEPKDAAKTVEPEPAPTPPATAPTRSANPSAEVKAPEPEEESGFHGFTLAARGDLVAFRAAAAGGVTARLDGAWFGGALSVIAPQLATRLEGRFHPVELRIVEPYLAVGGTLFLPVGAVHQTTFGLRGALGVDLRLGHVRFFVDVAYERYLNQTEAYSSDVVLLGAGAGWCF